MNQIEYTLPAYWAPYLINGDATNLQGEEQRQIDQFLARHNLTGSVDCSESSWFARRNDFDSAGGDVCVFTFLV